MKIVEGTIHGQLGHWVWRAVDLAFNNNLSIHLSLCAMEYDQGTLDHIAGGTCDESDMIIDLDALDECDIGDHVNGNTASSVHSETFGDDADVSELATTDSVMHDSDCELVACTFRPKNNEYDQHPDHESDYEFESPAVSPDNDDYTVVTHPHRRSTEFNETNSQPQPPPVGSRGGDGDAAAGPSQSQSNNIGNNDGNDNSDNSGSGSDWDDSGFDRLGYHFCSHCIQCGRCELCGYVLRVRRPVYLPASSSGHSCDYQRQGRHHCDACWLVGMCDMCGDTLRDYRPDHEFSD